MQPAPPLADDELRRQAAFRALGLPDAQDDLAFAALAQCAAQVAGCSMAAISVLDDAHEWFKAVHGGPAVSVPKLPRESSFGHHVVTSGGTLEVPDAALDARFAGIPWVSGPARLRFYAGVPLRVRGATLGALCVGHAQPHRLSAAQREALRGLARAAAQMLSHDAGEAPPADDERRRLLDFARASGDWMWETDAELRYTWVSGNFEAITGLPPSSMKGQPIADSALLGSLGQPRDGQTLHTLLRRQQPITRVITDKHTARGTLQVSRSAVPVFDVQGRFSGYRGTARDVSSHIAAERLIHGQAELLRKLSAQVPGVIFQLWLKPDHSVRYLYASDAWRDIFGSPPPRDDGSGGATSICHIVHRDDAIDLKAALVQAAAGLKPLQREYRVLRPDGSVRWLETRAVPEPHPQGGTLWHGFTSDVTQQKEVELALRSNEERWSLAAAAAGIGIAQIGLHSQQIYFDARACADHGLTFPQRDLPVSRWLQSIHADDRPGVEAALQQAIATQGRLEVRFRWQRADGEQPTLEFFARCMLDDDGRVDSLVGTCRDVTQQVAHDQLRHDKEAAERASRAKSEFLSRVSHELRTPLNGILGFAQLMAIDRVHPLPAEQVRRLKSVLRAGQHLLELINDMLNLARIEHEDFSLQLAPVKIATVIDVCFGLIQPLAESAGVRLLAAPREPHLALADARALEQVLLNLLSNAIKYNRRGGSVKVKLEHRGNRVGVMVTDQGEGLSAEQQAHLFQPFNRLGAEQRRVEGTGLGLVIARELTASMKGELTVHSTLGEGSTFTLWLHTDPAPSSPEAAESGFGMLPPPPHAARRHVLYIEDEPLNVLLMQEVFKARPQWELEVAFDGKTGLARVNTRAFDLLLIDMNLPDTTGLDLIRQLRRDTHTQGLHCIALSADAMQAQIDAAMSAGFDGYWTKPINVSHILENLGRVLSAGER